MSSEKFHVPELTADNFVDWESKMKAVLRAKGLYQLVTTKEKRGRDAKGKFVKVADPEIAVRMDLAHALIITRISGGISGRLKRNGGDDCPIQLWTNIQEFGSSKKQANVFKAWHRINCLRIDPMNVQKFISDYFEAISILQSLDIRLDDESLGHHILSIIPPSLSHVRNSLISSGTSSLIPVTYETVLEMLDSQVKSDNPSDVKVSKSTDFANSDFAEALLTQSHCPPGKHLSSARHPEDKCFSLHPELLKKYRSSFKSPETNLTTAFEALNMEANVDPSDPSDEGHRFTAANFFDGLYDDEEAVECDPL